ncbi:hypothetical protein [Neisseria subflava]
MIRQTGNTTVVEYNIKGKILYLNLLLLLPLIPLI